MTSKMGSLRARVVSGARAVVVPLAMTGLDRAVNRAQAKALQSHP